MRDLSSHALDLLLKLGLSSSQTLNKNFHVHLIFADLFQSFEKFTRK